MEAKNIIQLMKWWICVVWTRKWIWIWFWALFCVFFGHGLSIWKTWPPLFPTQSYNLLPTFRSHLKAPPPPHTPTVGFTSSAYTHHLPGYSYVAESNSFAHTQTGTMFYCFLMEHFFVDIMWSQIINNTECAGATRSIIIWNDITLDNLISLKSNVKI
jgi:hypothetical protein